MSASDRGTRLFRDKGGNLVIVGFFEEKGLFWTDYSEQEIVLEMKKDWTSRRDRRAAERQGVTSDLDLRGDAR